MEVTVIKSKRKSISIQINPDCTITVRAPRYASKRDIDTLIAEKQSWIQKHLKQMREKRNLYIEKGLSPLTDKEIQELADRALKYIPERVRYYSSIAGISYGRITIRNQRTRWGSCSAKGNLNFNCLLMLAPAEVIDYVVIHELCHRKEMNHSKAFWHEVELLMPDYKSAVKWLNTEGGQLMYRLNNR